LPTLRNPTGTSVTCATHQNTGSSKKVSHCH